MLFLKVTNSQSVISKAVAADNLELENSIGDSIKLIQRNYLFFGMHLKKYNY